MNKKLLKKIYSLIFLSPIAIGVGIIFSASANAQIVYTDVNPDQTFICPTLNGPSQSYNLDLNNDGITDFLISAIYNLAWCSASSAAPIKQVSVTPQNTNQVNVNMLNYNDTIGSNLVFSNSSGILRKVNLSSDGICGGASSGSWTTSSPHYLALQITVGTNTYNGWVRLNVGVPGNFPPPPGGGPYFTVKDYAYNSIPDQPILAGEVQPIITGTVENSFASSITIFPNPAIDKLTIALGSNNQKVEVTITDVNGKILYATTAGETQRIEVNTQDFAAGIYMVRIQAAGFIATKKLIIEK